MNVSKTSNPNKEDDHFLESGDRHDRTNENRLRQHCNLLSNRVLRTTMLFVVVVVSCIVILDQTSNNPLEFFHGSNLFSSSSSSFLANNEETNVLKNVLDKASMADKKTVIITMLNSAWTEPNSIFDLFLESFKVGNQTEKMLKHVVAVAFDKIAYNRCLESQLHCYALTTEGVDFSGEKVFMSEDYLKMTLRKIDFLRLVLEMGYNFVFTDADVIWLRDPFQRFYSDGDFQMACDHYYNNLNYTDRGNSPNTGFHYVKSNNKTVKFYKFWYEGRLYFPGRHDQDVLNMIKFSPFVDEIGLEMRFLDTAYFGGFCEPSKDLDLVVTMHANCCIGSYNKIHDIKMVIEDWKRYYNASLSAGNNGGGEKNATWRSWTVPRYCG